MLFDKSDTKMLCQSIFGPFLKFSKSSLVMFRFKKLSTSDKFVKIVKFLLLLVALAPIVARFIYLAPTMGYLPNFSRNWAWTFTFTLFSMQGVASIIILFSKNRHDFFKKYLEKLKMVAGKEEPLKKSKIQKIHILMGIFMLYLFYVIILFSVENGFEYDRYVTNVTNSTASFRKSIFGSPKFFFIDILMLLWTAFITGIVRVLFILCFKRIVEEYTRFNVHLQKSLENKEIDPNFVLTEIESHHNNLLDLIKFNNEEWSNVATTTFLTGFVMQIMCGFLLKSFSDDVSIITKVMMFSYTALGIMLTIIATKLPSDIQTKLIETQDIVLSNPILDREQSEKIISSVDLIIRRLQKPTLSMYIMNFFKLTPQFQAGAMLLFAILIEFFNAYKKNSP